MIQNKIFLLLCLVLTLAAVSCTLKNPAMRHEVTQRIASPSFMVERQIPAGQFTLTAFERMHERGAPAHIYIEGENALWPPEGDIGMPGNPTPENPVGLHLASRDLAENLVWLSRPCQYAGFSDHGPCDSAYWTSHRFSPAVLDAYEAALDDIKTRYDITEFHIVGFGGGGTLAALLAARRGDIVTLRTVAAPLDYARAAAAHGRMVDTASLNPPDFAGRLRRVPQYHFLGAQDHMVPPAALHSYLDALGESPCVHHDFIQDAGHKTGWVDKWPELLARELRCTREIFTPEIDIDFEPASPPPVYTTPDRPVKP